EERLAVGAIENEEMRRLAAIVDRLARLAVDHDVREQRRQHVIHVPDVLVNGLEMPLVGTGLEIERYERVCEEIQSRTSRGVLSAAILCAAPGVVDGDVDHAEFRIDSPVDPRAASPSLLASSPSGAGIGRDAVHVGDDSARLCDTIKCPDHAAVTRPQTHDRVARPTPYIDHSVVIKRCGGTGTDRRAVRSPGLHYPDFFPAVRIESDDPIASSKDLALSDRHTAVIARVLERWLPLPLARARRAIDGDPPAGRCVE